MLHYFVNCFGKQKIAKLLLRWFGGPPPLPTTYEGNVQGPLTQQVFVDFVIKHVHRLYPEYSIAQLKRYLQPDEFTGRSEPAGAAFILNYWKNPDECIERFLERELLEYKGDITAMFHSHLRLYLNEMVEGNTRVFDHTLPSEDLSVEAFIELTKRKDFVGHFLTQRSKVILSNPKVYEACVQNSGYGWPLIKMAEWIQMDIKYALMMIRNNPTDVCYLRQEWLDNMEIGEAIVSHPEYCNSIQYMSARVKNDRRLALMGLYYKEGTKADFGAFGSKIRDDDVLFLIAYINYNGSYHAASKRLRKKYWYLKPN